MLEVFISVFVGLLIAVSLIGPLSTEVNTASATGSALANSSSWGANVLKLVPGFYALMALLIAVAGLYIILRRAGMAG